MKNIYWGRIANYNQWCFKFFILYFEYTSTNLGYGFNLYPRLLQFDNKKNKDIFRPAIYTSLYLGFIGSLEININNKETEW